MTLGCVGDRGNTRSGSGLYLLNPITQGTRLKYFTSVTRGGTGDQRD